MKPDLGEWYTLGPSVKLMQVTAAAKRSQASSSAELSGDIFLESITVELWVSGCMFAPVAETYIRLILQKMTHRTGRKDKVRESIE